MTTTKEPEIKPARLPQPFDEKHLDALLVEIGAADRPHALALLRQVYARGLEHGAAICALWRAQKQRNADAVVAHEDKVRQRAAAASLEVAADAMIRTAQGVRGGLEIAGEIDELRAQTMRKEEPDPGSVLGWLKEERARARPLEKLKATLDGVFGEPRATEPPEGESLDLANASTTIVVRSASIAFPDDKPLNVGDPVALEVVGHIARAAFDRHVGGLSVAIEIVDVPDDDTVTVRRTTALAEQPPSGVAERLRALGVLEG